MATNAVDVLCNKCQKPVQGRIVSAMGKTWHPEHFTCAQCNKPIGGDRFNQKDGKPYCEDDYSTLFLQRCAKCNQPIKEKIIIALDKNWHAEHFVCIKCGIPLAEQPFCEKNGDPYCVKDFQQQFSPECYVCHKPIIDAAVVALGQKYHQQCFKCSKCQTVLTEAFQVLNGNPLCSSCAG